jgi:hypothetical protein
MKRFLSLTFFASIACLFSGLACRAVEKEIKEPRFNFALQHSLQPQGLSQYPIIGNFRKDSNAYRRLSYNAGIQVGYLHPGTTTQIKPSERLSRLHSFLDYGKFSLSAELIMAQGATRKFIHQSARPWAFTLQPSYRIWKDYDACLGYSCFWENHNQHSNLSGYSVSDAKTAFAASNPSKVHSVYIGVGTNVGILNRFLKEKIRLSLGYEYSRASQPSNSKKNAKVDMNAIRTRLQWVF